MIQYAKFGIECTSKKSEDIKVYKEFKGKLKKYLVDEGMQLYKIPITSDEYTYAHELALKYAWDWNRSDDRMDFQGLYVDEQGLIETVYSKEDFQKAEAYLVNFWHTAFAYEDTEVEEITEPCCHNPTWKYDNYWVSRKPYQMPRSEFGKHNCAYVEVGYAISEAARDLLINNRYATEDDFLQLTDRKGRTVCYQLNPRNKVRGFANDNNMKLVDRCNTCGLEAYGYTDEPEPYHISRHTLSQLKGINQTTEFTMYLSDSSYEIKKCDEGENLIGIPDYIVNKEVYELLTKKYKNIQFIPIFTKE